MVKFCILASTISSAFLDPALLKELEETRKAVQEAKEVFQSSRGTLCYTVPSDVCELCLFSA